MMLSEFKGWYKKQLDDLMGRFADSEQIPARFIREFAHHIANGLASVEDGAEAIKEIACPCCDAPLAMPEMPEGKIDIPALTEEQKKSMQGKCRYCLKDGTLILQLQFNNDGACYNPPLCTNCNMYSSGGVEDVPRGTKDPEIRSCDDLSEDGGLCHYCKNSLLLIPHPTAPHPIAKVCAVCHLYQL